MDNITNNEDDIKPNYVAMLDYRLNECETMLLNTGLSLQTRSILLRQNDILLGCYQQAASGELDDYPDEAMAALEKVFEHSRKVLDKIREAHPGVCYTLAQVLPTHIRIQ